MLETSRGFDSETVETLNKKQKEIDSLLSKIKKLEAEQSTTESEPQARVLDMQCRSMRDNLIFYKVPEARGETDGDCVRKMLKLIEDDLEIVNVTRNIKLHRVHRMGRYDQTKIRPILANFAYFPDRKKSEKMPGNWKIKRPASVNSSPRR